MSTKPCFGDLGTSPDNHFKYDMCWQCLFTLLAGCENISRLYGELFGIKYLHLYVFVSVMCGPSNKQKLL